MRRMHISLSVTGALLLSDRELHDQLKDCITEDGKLLHTGAEIRKALTDALAEGIELIPYGECDNFDPKKGCMGHEVQENQA